MDPEAAAPLADAHQGVDEFRQFGSQGGELVHDHHQPGQRVLAALNRAHLWVSAAPARASRHPDLARQQVSAAARRLSPVRLQVFGAGPAQPLLPVAQFGLQAAQGPLGQPVVEVGDQARHMG